MPDLWMRDVALLMFVWLIAHHYQQWYLVGTRRKSIWLWTAMDPISKFWLVFQIGDRTAKNAWAIVHKVAMVLKKGLVPLFLTDGNRAYEQPILSHYGESREKGNANHAGSPCPIFVMLRPSRNDGEEGRIPPTGDGDWHYHSRLDYQGDVDVQTPTLPPGRLRVSAVAG